MAEIETKKRTRDVARKKKRLSRRDFLKLGGISAAAAVGTLASGNTFGLSKPKASRRLAMVIDLRKCIGCHACSVACKAEFAVPLGVWRSWVKQVDVGRYPNVKRYFLPRLCNHCDEPPCVKVCPTRASYIRPEDNTVQIKEDRCIGCRLCISGCPYNSRFSHPDKKIANKCTFCIHRVDKGLVPACVNTCQAKARIFGDLNDANSEVFKLVATQPAITLKSELGTQPKVFYIAPDKEAMGNIREVS
jgi:tetrathionate reductase subunit B